MTNEIVKQDAQEVQTVSGYEAFRERCAKTIELCDDAMMAHDDYVLDPSECAGIVRALPLPEVKFAPIGVDDLVAVHRSLLGAACSAISKKRDAPRTVANLRRHTTGDLSVSSSVEYLRKENEELRSRISKNVPLLVNETLEYEIEDSRQENAQLRELLCLRSALPTHMPYMDDGELQDNSEFPCIDYKRDSVAEIISKLQQRTLNALKGGAA